MLPARVDILPWTRAWCGSKNRFEFGVWPRTRIRPVSVQAGDPREPWQRVSAELEVYLGSQMTTRLIEAARQSSQEVRGILATARPVLTGLLGERTAFNVTTRLFKIFAPGRTLA